MAIARLDVGFDYKLEIDQDGQLYLALGPAGERVPIMMTELVLGPSVNDDRLMRMNIGAKFVTVGAPEQRRLNAPIIVIQTNATRRLRLRDNEKQNGHHA